MKRPLLILLAALVLGAGAFWLCRHLIMQPSLAIKDDPIGWLAGEYQLDAMQTQRVRALHAEYEPRCMEMCRKVNETNERIAKMMTEQTRVTPEIEAALRESAQLQANCRREMLTYIYTVAAELPATSRSRYVALMKTRVLSPGLPHVIEGAHEAAPHHHP